MRNGGRSGEHRAVRGCAATEGQAQSAPRPGALATAGRRSSHTGLRSAAAELWIRVWLLRTTWDRAIQQGAEPGAPSFSVLKLLTSETWKAIGDLGTEALGPDAAWSEDDQPLVRAMLVGHAQTILGGTSEIQRNILSERILGLPREPAAAPRQQEARA